MSAPPYSTRGYDSDEQEAIMEAGTAYACDKCDKTFAGTHALAVHHARMHGSQKAKMRTPVSKLPASRQQAVGNGTVDGLVQQLALALLDQALDDLRTKVHAAL